MPRQVMSIVDLVVSHLSHCVRKPTFCICENKDADQLRGTREADQRLCFRYLDSTIPLLPNPKFPASSHLQWLYSLVCVRPGQNPNCWFFSRRGSFGFEGRTLVLIASVPGHCLHFTFSRDGAHLSCTIYYYCLCAF